MPGKLTYGLLDASETLLKAAPASAAFRRRAVSTAYYAVFHALAQACADILLPVNRDQEEYARLYRALDHGALKSAFGGGPLKGRATLRLIGDLVVRLQAERHRADYLPDYGTVFSLEQAEELVTQARQAVSMIEGLRPCGRIRPRIS